jgi:hypothetical protein
MSGQGISPGSARDQSLSTDRRTRRISLFEKAPPSTPAAIPSRVTGSLTGRAADAPGVRQNDGVCQLVDAKSWVRMMTSTVRDLPALDL